MSDVAYKSKKDNSKEEPEKLSGEEKKYLNSKARVVKRFLFAILEYVILFILMLAIACYLKNGNLDNFMEEVEGLKDWFQPGGLLFNALVGYLPIVVIGCIGAYFGEGTVGKMVFGLIKCGAILIWLLFVFDGAAASLQMPDIMESINVEDLTIGLEGLSKLAVLVLTCSLLIPIGEFCGARKKHKRALAKKERLEAAKAEE